MPKLSVSYQKYLDEAGALLRLPASTTAALLPAYVSSIDDLLPVLDGQKVWREHSNEEASVYLVRAICLAACKLPQALPFLRLEADGPVLVPLDFASKILVGLEAAMGADLESNRVIKVQIRTLMHLHNDGVTGMDRASGCLSQAIHEAWAMSLHWNIPGNPDHEQDSYLWWTLRNLDKLNKPLMGAAPFMIDDTDIGLDRIDATDRGYRSQVMDVSVKLGDLMIMATKIYKATSKATTDQPEDFPSLAQIVNGEGFMTFHKSHRRYLEIWYYVAAMLSCRYSGPGSVPYNRRLAAAESILDILSEAGLEQLPPLPLIPYGASLASTMIYRAFRDSQQDYNTATRKLTLCCEVLQTLGSRWTSAQALAKLARRLLKVMAKSRTPSSTGIPRPTQLIDDQGHRADANAHQDNTGLRAHILPVTADTGVEVYNPGVNGWDSWDVPYAQLDAAFQDMFDYGMPNAFRGGEYFYTAVDDGSSVASDPSVPQAFYQD